MVKQSLLQRKLDAPVILQTTPSTMKVRNIGDICRNHGKLRKQRSVSAIWIMAMALNLRSSGNESWLHICYDRQFHEDFENNIAVTKKVVDA